MSTKFIRNLVIFILVALAYANTCFLDYALDDRLVIFENDYTVKGFDGIKDVLTKDSFSGYFGHEKKLVAGGRYRPLAQITFILEYEIFGQKVKEKAGLDRAPQNEELFTGSALPFISHLVNILLYALLCMLIYNVLKRIFARYDDPRWYLSLPFLAALLFALHPLHTEAVANIKGRDEILSMLGAFATLWCVIKFMSKKNPLFLILSFFTMTMGLFSKENSITFLVVIPLALYFMNIPKTKTDWVLTILPALLASVFFLVVRNEVLGAFMVKETYPNILNNPFVFSSKVQEIATVIFTWGIYLKLLIFPHPLTHDYYPKQIQITDFSNPVVILLLLFFLFVIFYAIKNLKKKNLISFGILFFIFTFSATSNLFFNVGTFMNERFVFIPLLGFTIILSALILKLSKHKFSSTILPVIFIIFFSLYTVKTFARNFVWKNDVTLFTTDVNTSSNSIKCNISAGGSYVKLYKESKKEKDYDKSLKYLYKAIELDSTAFNAHMLLGELYYYKGEYDLSYQFYKNAAIIDPQNASMVENMNIALTAKANSAVKVANDKLNEKDVKGALEIINQYLKTNPNSADAYNMKGKILGMGMNQIDSSIIYLEKALAINPNFVSALENLGVAYAIQGKLDKALTMFSKAYELDTTNTNVIKNIANVYNNKGDLAKYKQWMAKLSH